MARKRPNTSHVTRPVLTCVDRDRPSAEGALLASGEAEALRRGAPLTHAKLTEIVRARLADRARADRVHVA